MSYDYGVAPDIQAHQSLNMEDAWAYSTTIRPSKVNYRHIIHRECTHSAGRLEQKVAVEKKNPPE